MIRVTIDLELCESNGVCEGLAPEIFQLDDEALPQIRVHSVTSENEELVRRAALSCPRTAIDVSSDPGSEDGASSSSATRSGA